MGARQGLGSKTSRGARVNAGPEGGHPIGVNVAPLLRTYGRPADGLFVQMEQLTDADMALVAGVARREGWDHTLQPPAGHGPRTLAEAQAVDRFQVALRARRDPPPVRVDLRTRIARLSTVAKTRIAMVLAAVLVLGVCWAVSPQRTALGLLGAGIICLIAARRRGRRDPSPAGRPTGVWSTAVRRR